MARFGRGYPIRPVASRQPYRLDQVVALPVWETVSEWPALSVVTPDAHVELPAWETVSEWPAPTFAYGQSVALPVWETASEWPALSVLVAVQPGDLITGDYQIEFGGLLFGGYGNPYQVLAGSLEGWDDLPSLDSGNVARPSRHGSWPGRKLSQDRQVQVIIGIDTSGDFTAALSEIRRVFVPADDETEAFLVVSGRDEVLLAQAQVDARVIPTQDYAGGWAPVSVRWTCPDPRRYGLARHGVTVPLGAQTQLFNAGNTASHPLIRIPGPTQDPVIVNAKTGRTLQLSIVITSGQRLDIDTDAGTVAVGDTNKMSALTGTSVPVQDFVLAAGANPVTFTAASGGGGGGVDFLWRDAHL